MLNENGLPKYFWAEAVNTACYIMNMTHIRSILKRTLYELQKGRLSNISYFHAFGCKCFVHNNGKETLGKFDAKSVEGIRDKIRDLNINDKKIESSKKIQEESKGVKNSDLPKEWRYVKS